MATNVSILIFGRYPLLLQTRRWLLQAAGYRVEVAENLYEAKKAIAAQRIDLLILCHSLSATDSEQAAAAIESHWPDSRCLVLSAERDDLPLAPCGEFLQVVEGPKKFVAKVQAIVSGEETGVFAS